MSTDVCGIPYPPPPIIIILYDQIRLADWFLLSLQELVF